MEETAQNPRIIVSTTWGGGRGEGRGGKETHLNRVIRALRHEG